MLKLVPSRLHSFWTCELAPKICRPARLTPIDYKSGSSLSWSPNRGVQSPPANVVSAGYAQTPRSGLAQASLRPRCLSSSAGLRPLFASLDFVAPQALLALSLRSNRISSEASGISHPALGLFATQLLLKTAA